MLSQRRSITMPTCWRCTTCITILVESTRRCALLPRWKREHLTMFGASKKLPRWCQSQSPPSADPIKRKCRFESVNRGRFFLFIPSSHLFQQTIHFFCNGGEFLCLIMGYL